MVTKINTEVTLKNGYKFVIIDISNIDGQEVALAAPVASDFDKNPQATFLLEKIAPDGSVMLGCVRDTALIEKAIKKFKIRLKI